MLTAEERAEIAEVRRIITSDMGVDAGPALLFVLERVGQTIDAVLLGGVVILEEDEEADDGD
jgi:hypothetical protein